MTDLNEEIRNMEAAVTKFDTGDADAERIRRIIRLSFQRLARIDQTSSLSFADIFENVVTKCHTNITKEMGAITVRLVCCTNLLPASTTNKASRFIVQIIEIGCRDLLVNVLSDKKAQTHEKFNAICRIHREACNKLQILRQSFSGLHDLSGRRQSIMRELNHGPTREYLNTFGFLSVLPSITSLLRMTDKVNQSQGRELQTSMQNLLETLSDEINYYTNVSTFVVQDYMLPFLHDVHSSALALQATMADRFSCTISVPTSPHMIEKNYPLHVVGSKIQIFVPLANDGPGAAENVQVHCIADHCDVQSEETHLGSVEPGSFILTLIIRVTEPRNILDLYLSVEWSVVGSSSLHTKDFAVRVIGQRTDLNWDELSRQQPYSLEVAYENEFYGRKDAVQRIVGRLAPDSMQSCYITGQKRVGKSSLAHAVETQIRRNIHPGEYFVLYLECGEVRYASGEDTLNEIGIRLETFLTNNLFESCEWKSRDYSSSLAPLNRLLEQLKKDRPIARFVVILDEFDEINETLYRHGELANTFFLNLRTLSSKRNMAFILVGAERMPYLMASQGEKLNKFARESLDSFNRNEWADYRSLIESPVKDSIKLHEPALRKLYEFTNGHPYFTKVVCAMLYECAVETKDAEVSSAEVANAAERVIADLDINAFAHYWRDGVRGDANDVAIISLNRCRLLVAWARTSRSRKTTTHEFILENIRSSALPEGDVLPLLDDLCRRGVFQQRDDVYVPTVELFGVWLREGGFSMLISDQLGDELAEAKQQREDAAYVQAQEIVDLANRWDLYQGRQVTEENIRAWIGQVESNVEQRLLFKIIQNVRFFRDPEIREQFSHVHARLRTKLPTFIKKSRAQRRDDIFVSYVDGPGKSGAHYAALYTNTNEIVSENIVDPAKLGNLFDKSFDDRQIGLVIVDDMIGTGDNLVKRLPALLELFRLTRIGTKIPLSVVVLCSTVEGERRVRGWLEEFMPNADLEVCERLCDTHLSFGDDIGFWESIDEMNSAKTLLRDIGARIHKRRPLGYKEQGLLLTFSRNCPNNSLPILHSSGRGENHWTPLFPRSRT